MTRDFYKYDKQRLAYVYTLPNIVGAKPKGLNNTPKITKCDGLKAGLKARD
jgi:hypothetical protein